MPYRPADFSGLMKDYAVGMQMRYTYDTHARELEINNAERAMTGLSYIEGLYVDEKAKWEEKHGSVDIEKFDDYFAEKYPAVRDKLKGYFNDYAAQEWADNGETDPDHPVEIIKSGFKKGMYMLLGRNAKGEPVPKTENGSSDGKDPIIELSAEQLLKNTRYNIALKYGINPVTAGQMATGLAGGTIYGEGSLAGTQQPSAETTSEADSAPLGTTTPSTATPGSAPVAGEPDVTTPAGSGSLAAGASSVPAYLADGRSIEQAEISANQTPTKTGMGADGTVEPLGAKAVNAKAITAETWDMATTTPKAIAQSQPQNKYPNVGVAGSGAPDVGAPNPVHPNQQEPARNMNPATGQVQIPGQPGYQNPSRGKMVDERYVPTNMDATPQEIDEAWAKDIAAQEDNIARNTQAGEQFAQQGNEVEAARYKRGVAEMKKKAAAMKSAKERGLSRDEFETEQKRVNAVDRGLIKSKKAKKIKETSANNSGEEWDSTVNTEDEKVKVANESQGEEIDADEMGSNIAKEGGSRETAKNDAVAATTAVGASGVQKTMELQFPGNNTSPFTGTKVSVRSPAKRVALMTLAMQGNYLPKNEKGLSAMNTYIQTGRMPEDIAQHFKNQQAYAAAAASFASANHSAAQIAALKLKTPVELQRAYADLQGQLIANQQSLEELTQSQTSGRLKKDLENQSALIKNQQAWVQLQIDRLTAGHKAQAELTEQQLKNKQTQLDFENSVASANQKAQTELREKRDRTFDASFDSFNNHINKDRFKTLYGSESAEQLADFKASVKNRVMAFMDQNEAKLVQALMIADPNNPAIAHVIEKLTKGQPITGKDYADALVNAKLGDQGLMTVLTGHSMMLEDIARHSPEFLKGETGEIPSLYEFISKGENAQLNYSWWDEVTANIPIIGGRSDQDAYNYMLKQSINQSGVQPLLMQGIFRALAQLSNDETKSMQARVNEARKNTRISGE